MWSRHPNRRIFPSPNHKIIIAGSGWAPYNAAMIALLTGVLRDSSDDSIVVEVNGVGYEASISAQTRGKLPALGQQVTLFVHTHVREDQITLFGFASRDERALFQRLITVNGIGPRLALTILSGMAPADLVTVVTTEDTAQLTAVPGIGKKTAERIVLDLRDRLLKEHASLIQLPHIAAAGNSLNEDALSALLNLGYARNAAEDALRTVQEHTPELPLGGIIKHALKELSGR